MEVQVQKCKIIVIGDQYVGKTSIINPFIFDNMIQNYKPTLLVDYVSKTVCVDNKNLRMQFRDTAGQERFHSLIPTYIKDCIAAIIVFDLTSISYINSDVQSYDNLSKWIDNVRQVRGQQALIMVIGNKLDLQTERQVQRALAQDKCKEIGCKYQQLSAKTGSNVKQFFKELALAILENGQIKKSDGKTEANTSKAPSKTNNFNLVKSDDEYGKKNKKVDAVDKDTLKFIIMMNIIILMHKINFYWSYYNFQEKIKNVIFLEIFNKKHFKFIKYQHFNQLIKNFIFYFSLSDVFVFLAVFLFVF